MPNDSGPWQVVSQRETSDMGPDGLYTHGFRVSFTTAGGHQGSVFIPDALYFPDNVRAMIAARAEVMDRVGNLAG